MTTLYVYRSQNSGWTWLFHDIDGRRIDGQNSYEGRTDALFLGCQAANPDQIKFGRPSDFPAEASLLSTRCELAHEKETVRGLTKQLRDTQECREMYAERWAHTKQELDELKNKLRDLLGDR
jgi:hypothetical protein